MFFNVVKMFIAKQFRLSFNDTIPATAREHGDGHGTSFKYLNRLDGAHSVPSCSYDLIFLAHHQNTIIVISRKTISSPN